MDRSYESAFALVRPAVGPVSEHLGAFVTSLIAKQYSVAVVYIKTQQAVAFDRWFHKHRTVLAAFDEGLIARYQRRHSRRSRARRLDTRRRELCVAAQLLHFLREQGVCKWPQPVAVPADDTATDFAHYLRDERGLTEATIQTFTREARQFLKARFASGQVRLRRVRPADVIAFVQDQSKHRKPVVMKSVVTALRSFFRYAQYRGETGAALVASVPSVASWVATPPVPCAISPEHAKHAIESCNRSTAVGRRDRAVLLLLARLGLRACEIIRMTLDDIDWDNGYLKVHGKGRYEGLLPLPRDVGEAIAAYLRDGRPTSEDRHLFLRSHAPIRGLKEGSDAIGSIVKYALGRAKIDAPHRGTHQFRHALAVNMLKRGASLPEIGEVLRHRSPVSTAIYARVDIQALQELAMAWPGGAR
jgi:integrase/recombinase XerD